MDLERIRPEIAALVARGNVTREELQKLSTNSWEWEALVPVMTDEYFLDRFEYCLANCFTPGKGPFSTYNAAVEGLWAPDLIRRFRRRMSDEQLAKACENFGIDLKCGACAEQFYTGARMHEHDPTCSTYDRRPNGAQVFARVIEILLAAERDANQCAFIAGTKGGEALRVTAGAHDVPQEMLVQSWKARAAETRNIRERIIAAFGVVAPCHACKIESEIGTEDDPHPIPQKFHSCVGECGDI